MNKTLQSQSLVMRSIAALIALLGIIVGGSVFLHSNVPARATGATTQHYEYVFPDGSIYVYDMDNGQKLVKHINLSMFQGGRGAVVDPASNALYLSYNGDGGPHGNGSLLKYNLLTDTVVWTKNYPFGIDSMAISRDGKTIYMPDGEASYDGTWHILNTSDGSATGSIFVGTGVAAHNTIVSLNGSHAYLGGLNYDYLVQVNTSNNTISKRIGPLTGGLRPFTINGKETLAFTTATNLLGFQVSSITSGKVLYTVPVKGFTAPANSDPSHGISLSPDEKEVYVMDSVNSYVHVFDVSGLPSVAPKQVANIPLQAMTGTESPCLYDCNREGWVLHSGDGRYVYVGDSGDVIDTSLRKSVINLPALYNTRKCLEIDWSNGLPTFTTSRYGLGYVTGITPTPTPSPSPTPSTLAQDTFQRPNQQFWGTASDSQSWGDNANTKNVFSINGNAGQVANGTGTYGAILGPTATDAEVLFSGSLNSFTKANVGAMLRWSDPNNWYRAYITGTNLVLQARVNGAYTTLGSTAFTATGGTSYSLRFRVVGTTLYAKVWQTSTTEPTNWMITATNSSLTTGNCGLQFHIQSSTTATITSFLATTAS